MKHCLKKCISLLLVLVMLLSMAPTAALADGGEALRCRFPSNAEALELTVYDAAGDPIAPDEEGFYLLIPGGAYSYDAAAEGYAPVKGFAFSVPEDAEGDQELRVVMTRLEDVQPAADGNPAEAGPVGGIFDAHFGKYQVFDVQRSPRYPRGTQQNPNAFTVRELSAPLGLTKLSEEDSFTFRGLGYASELGYTPADGWDSMTEGLDPYVVELHLLQDGGDTVLGSGVIGALSSAGFLFDMNGRGLWFSNEKGYYYSSTSISCAPMTNGRLVCDLALLTGFPAQSMLEPDADASKHVHHWITVNEDNTAVFRCTEDGCPFGTDVLYTESLEIPAFLAADRRAEARLEKSVRDADWPEELEQNIISYVGRGETQYGESIHPPTEPGTYTAKVTVGYRQDVRVLEADFAIVTEEPVPFEQTRTVNGLIVTVKAEAGVLPADAVLKVTEAEPDGALLAAARVKTDKRIADYGVDIAITDGNGELLTPADGHSIQVSLLPAETPDENLTTLAYRMTADAAKPIGVNGDGGCTVEETACSLRFVVELTYPTLRYSLQGKESVALSEILAAVGLSGTAATVEVRDPDVLYAFESSGAWRLRALRGFAEEERIRVTVRNLVYEIRIEDGDLCEACLKGHYWSADNGTDPVYCLNCGELKAIAEGGRFDLEFDDDRWIVLGDPEADTETYLDWDEAFEDFERTGSWPADLAAVAATQLDYTESASNFAMNARRERNGYTRYGAWYGMPYGEWCAMFVSFCLHYAGIEDEDFPYNAGCEAWVEKLRGDELFAPAAQLCPKTGDLIFYDGDGDGLADHVGIVSDYDADSGVIRSIEGNLDNRVQRRETGCYDQRILGYGLLPENPELLALAAYPALHCSDAVDGMTVDIDAPAGAFPKGTVVTVESIEEEAVLPAVEAAMREAAGSSDSVLEKRAVMARALGIRFFNEAGEELQPLRPFSVALCPAETEEEADRELAVVCIDDEGKGTELAEVARSGEALSFSAGSASTYVYTAVLVTRVLDSRGDGWRVSLTYDSDAGLPEDAELSAVEIGTDAEAYSEYSGRASAALAEDGRILDDVRLFDISILSDGEKVQPKAPVSVSIELDEALGDELSVLHLGEETEFMAAETAVKPAAEPKADEGRRSRMRKAEAAPASAGVTVSFLAEGFSVYAIVKATTAEEIPPTGWVTIGSAAELVQYGRDGIYIRHPLGYYFTDEEVAVTNTRYGIKKTGPWAGIPPEAQGAVPYYLDVVPGMTNSFRIHCGEDGQTLYVKAEGDSMSLRLTPDENEATTFTITDHPTGAEDTFLVKCDNTAGMYWNMRGGTAAQNHEFCIYTLSSDADRENSKIQFLRYAEPTEDPFHLDGAQFGLVRYNADYNENTADMGVAMMGSLSDGVLAGKEVDGEMEYFDFFEDYFLVPGEESTITLWGFESVPTASGQDYYLTATVGTQTKYLGYTEDTLGGGFYKLELFDEPNDNTLITVRAGNSEPAGNAVPTGGMIQLLFKNSPGIYVSNRNGTVAGGFAGSKTADANTWFYLATPSSLSDDAFRPYSAKKISVSDESLGGPYTDAHPKSKVIVYTRVWDEEVNRYKFFAIDKDGGLVRCYDGGDEIYWYDIDPQDLIWEFTEYLNDNDEPTWYYELESWYDKQIGDVQEYIAPQITGDQIMSDHKIGINMNGRRYGDYYSKIVAWDNPKYAYAGLRADPNTHTLEAVPMSLSDDWYFAIVSEEETPENQLSLAETVDHTAYGITMRMFDYNNSSGSTQDPWQTEVMGGYQTSLTQGLLTRNVGANGYPTATRGNHHSLAELFPAGVTANVQKAQTVNHLFIQHTLDESGYFEFDSTQNYAYLDESSGEFIVYDQLGSFERTNGSPSDTLKHGQFDPYDAIDANGDLIADNGITPQRNLYGIHGTSEPLSPLNPRYNEVLYKNGTQNTVDFHYGMEMTATFMQSPNGKDDWGHDIIFEFSGDDDFWLYVDGVLVLDLGGTHVAADGSVNFATGQVYNQGLPNGGKTTLRELFRKAYLEAHPGAGTEEVNSYLDGIFVPGDTVFQNYGSHTMQVFYMERGANASNLHMRFNLAPVKAGSVELEKHVEGTDKQNYASVRFPYQIFWRSDPGEEFTQVTAAEQDPLVPAEHAVKVFLKATGQPVECAAHYPDDSDPHYDDVFFLLPEQHAVIEFPGGGAENYEYYIKECFIDAEIYSQVDANEVVLSGEPGLDGRFDYPIEVKPVVDRKLVSYVNHVNPNKLHSVTFTKILHGKNGPLSVDDDPTPFRLRLFLGDSLDLYAVGSYHVKDPSGYYCVRENGEWVSTGKRDFNDLTDAQKEAATFVTGPWGTADSIQAGYSVEIRNLLPETKFKVEEWPGDLPMGYDLGYFPSPADPYSGEGDRDFVDYERVIGIEGATYDLLDNLDPPKYNIGRIKESLDARAKVHNRKGWGLGITKTWSDAAFMESHDDIYFAVYYHLDAYEELELLPNSVKRLQNGESSVVYFLDELVDGIPFNRQVGGELLPNYEVFEVQLTGDDLTVDGEGFVSGYTDVTRIKEGDKLYSGGVQIGQSHADYTYTARYEPVVWNSTGNAASFAVTNIRPGVRIVKRDWNNDPLLNAEFSLKYGNEPYGEGSYVSGNNGLVVMAYFGVDREYTLKEEISPPGYVAFPESINIRTDEKDTVTVTSASVPSEISIVYLDSDPPPTPEELSKADVIVDRTLTETEIATIIIRDRSSGMQLQKISSAGGGPMADVHFRLHRQVNGEKSPQPIPGYTDLVTNEQGLLPTSVFANLTNNRTYYLVEKAAPAGYAPLSGDIIFTLNAGVVSLDAPVPPGVVLLPPDPEAESRIYTIQVTNEARTGDLSISKTAVCDVAEVLAAASFTVEVQLTKAGTTFGTYTALVSKDGVPTREAAVAFTNGKASFAIAPGETWLIKDLPCEASYTVTETDIPAGWTMSSSSGMTGTIPIGSAADASITNSYPTVAISVGKDWAQQTVYQPDSVTVELYRQVGTGTRETVDTVELSADNEWSHTWEDLPKLGEDAAEYTYSVAETPVPAGYSVSYSPQDGVPGESGSVTVINTPVLAEVSVTKQWDDDNDAAGLRPDGVKVQLYRQIGSGSEKEKIDEQTLRSSTDPETDWKYTWTDLPKYTKVDDELVEITYSVAEDTVPIGYTAAVSGSEEDGFEISNTVHVTDVSVTKGWDDGGNRDGIRPGYVDVQLYRKIGSDAEQPLGASVRLNADNDWSHTWPNLPTAQGAASISYRVAELHVPAGYTVSYSPEGGVPGEDGAVTVTNTHPPRTIDISVVKVWKDGGSWKRPAKVTIKLLADGEEVDTVELSEDNEWSYTWEDLPYNVDGRRIVYTVDERRILFYLPPVITGSADSGFTVTNTLRGTPGPPTGDRTPWQPWTGALLLSGGLLLLDALLRKRRRRRGDGAE